MNSKLKEKREAEAQALMANGPALMAQTQAQTAPNQAQTLEYQYQDGTNPYTDGDFNAAQNVFGDEAPLKFPYGGEAYASHSQEDPSGLNSQHDPLAGLFEGAVDFTSPENGQEQGPQFDLAGVLDDIDWSDPALYEQGPK